MNKKLQSNYVAVLEALKAIGCIGGYSIGKDDVHVEWKAGGVERVVQEFIAKTPKPFALKRVQRGILILLLPQKERKRLDDIFISALKERHALPRDLPAG